MGGISEYVNKALLPVNFKAVISYIVEKFPENVEIIIAVGHEKESLKDYLTLIYPNRKITYVEIDKYLGPGTGPGYSLFKCKEHLQCPFIFSTADTIVLEEIPEPRENWYGIAPVKDTENYCTVKIKNNLICQLDDKLKTDNKYAFIGLAGIYDYELFFDALDKNRDLIGGEIQTSNGFKRLIERKLVPAHFTWFDTGNMEGYVKANESFSGGNEKFDFSKGDEFLYFVDGKVVKYFANREVAQNRFRRSKVLEGLCPKIEGCINNFYSYNKVDGQVLYDVLNSQIFRDFLHWSNRALWERKNLGDEELAEFHETCMKFYKDKTLKRVEEFHAKNKIVDTENDINGVNVPPLRELFAKVPWDEISRGIPVNFHGDFTVGNILVTREQTSQLQKFILLDWRQDFGGLLEHGDIYYDLAKLYKGIILSDNLIKEGKFHFDMSGSSVYYDYYLKRGLMDAKEDYEAFLVENGFDLNRVKIITALALLNMSPLHNYPFNFLVYYLGKNMLHKTINDRFSKGSC